MAKTKLNEYEKRYIRWFYLNEETSVTELSIRFKVSERTLRRVLKEFDLTYKDRKTYQVMCLIDKYNLTVEGLDSILKNKHAKYQD